MSFGEVLAMIPLGSLALYLGVRLISAAYFKSKEQYERQSNDKRK